MSELRLSAVASLIRSRASTLLAARRSGLISSSRRSWSSRPLRSLTCARSVAGIPSGQPGSRSLPALSTFSVGRQRSFVTELLVVKGHHGTAVVGVRGARSSSHVAASPNPRCASGRSQGPTHRGASQRRPVRLWSSSRKASARSSASPGRAASPQLSGKRLLRPVTVSRFRPISRSWRSCVSSTEWSLRCSIIRALHVRRRDRPRQMTQTVVMSSFEFGSKLD